MNTEGKSIRNGVLSSTFQIVISIVVAIVQVRLIVSFLPGEQAGIWFLFLSLGTLTAFCDLGLGPTVSREISFIAGRKFDQPVMWQQLANLYFTAQRLFRIVAVTVLLLGLVIGSLYLFFISPQQEFIKICTAWIVFMTGSAVNLWGGAVFAGLYGFGNVAPEKLIRSVMQLLGVLLIFLGLQHGAGLFFLSVVWLLQAILSRMAGWLVLRRRHPFLKEARGCYSAEVAGKLAKSGAWWMLTGAGSILLLQTDQLIVASFLGTTFVPSYEALLKMMATLSTVSVLLVTSSTPFISMAYAKGDMIKLQSRVLQNIRWSVLLMILSGSFVAAMGDKIVALWLGTSLFAGFPTLWALFFAFLLEVHYVSIAICTMATGHIVLYKATLISGILKIILSTCLVLKYGLVGIPLGTLIAHMLTNNLYAPRVLLKTLNISFRSYGTDVLRPVLLFGVYIIFGHLLIAGLLENWMALPSLLGAMVLSLLLTLPGVYLLVLHKEEICTVKAWVDRYVLKS